MPHNITFSRTFPAYHPKAGQPTYFAEALMSTYVVSHSAFNFYEWKDEVISLNPGKERMADLFCRSLQFEQKKFACKYHTIRRGHRWAPGMLMSARVWSGKPYRSPQIVFMPPFQVLKTYNIERTPTGNFVMDAAQDTTHLYLIAQNDALSLEDFKAWFHQPFSGQIICWSHRVDY